MRARSQGFTVIEAMVVVGIIAILAGFAAPAMNQLIRTQKVRSVSYDLFADLTYARSEAIARGHNVGIGSKGGNDWGVNGWMVRDLTSGEQLRDQGPTSKGVSFTADTNGLVFLPTGRTAANAAFTIKPVESAPDDQKRCVRITPSGRPNSITGVCP
jgi:prepilin-type N-terminal cleavage/methylation domain-containing protein